jgi:hypothetical protein
MLPFAMAGLLKESADSIKEASFWEQLKSAPFWRVTALLVVASFWANFYIGTIDIQVAT